MAFYIRDSRISDFGIQVVGYPIAHPLWVSTDRYIDRKETVKDKTHPRNEWNKEPPA